MTLVVLKKSYLFKQSKSGQASTRSSNKKGLHRSTLEQFNNCFVHSWGDINRMIYSELGFNLGVYDWTHSLTLDLHLFTALLPMCVHNG